MNIVTAAWAVGSLIFFKVALDAGFSRDVSIIGAALLGLMTAVSVLISARFYAAKLGRHQFRKLYGDPPNFLLACFPVWAIATFSNIVLGKLIVFGFSKKLNGNLGGSVLLDYGRFSHFDDRLLFAIVIAIPITVHLVMTV